MGIEWEIEELAYRVMGKTEEEAEKEINNGDIDDAIYKKYDISFDVYCEIVKDLIKFTPFFQSPLTGGKFHAFVDNEKQRAIVKQDV